MIVQRPGNRVTELVSKYCPGDRKVSWTIDRLKNKEQNKIPKLHFVHTIIAIMENKLATLNFPALTNN